MESRKKKYEKTKRKEFFLKSKYESIMNVEIKKVHRRLNSLRAMEKTEEVGKEIEEWRKKMNYIKHFPKNLKYVSLFPTNKPLQP